MPTASLYVRLSKTAGLENVSLAGMETDVRALADRLGCTVAALHVDDGISGAVRDRPEFLAWLDDAREGRADVLLAYHGDRLTREGVNAAALILDVIEGKDPATGKVVRDPVRFADCHGLDSERDAESFRWRFVIAAEVARAERERIKSRSQASRSRLVHAGRWHGGTTPYGFRAVDNPDGPGKVLDVNEVEAEFIRDAAAQVLAGVPLGRVCRKISEAGAKPRRAASFSRVTLRQVLTGEAVLGRVTHGGVLVRDEDGRPAQPFPPILSFETVSALREALKPKERKHAGRQPSRLLSGLLTCHSCGSVLLVARRSDGSVTYRCQRSSDGGRCEAQVVVAALPIEEWIEAHYLKAFGSLPLVEEVVEVVGGGALGEVEERISALSARLAKEATAETFAALQEAQKERDEAQAQPVERVRRMIATGETNGDRWRAGDVHDRRALLRDAFEVLVLGPGRRGPRGFDPERLQAIPRQVDPVVD